jgi:hypothetical protein
MLYHRRSDAGRPERQPLGRALAQQFNYSAPLNRSDKLYHTSYPPLSRLTAFVPNVNRSGKIYHAPTRGLSRQPFGQVLSQARDNDDPKSE